MRLSRLHLSEVCSTEYQLQKMHFLPLIGACLLQASVISSFPIDGSYHGSHDGLSYSDKFSLRYNEHIHVVSDSDFRA